MWFIVGSLIAITQTACNVAPTIPSPTALATSTTNDLRSPLRDLPLDLGNTWVYSDVVYGDQSVNAVVTATLIYTDSVVDTRINPPYFAAKINRDVSLFSGTSPFNAPESTSWWYVVSGTQVYKQPDYNLNFPNVTSSWLEYAFPLAGQIWYPDPEQRTKLAADSGIPGARIVSPAEDLNLPAGLFTHCFKIATVYNSGPTFEWLCPQVGIVAAKYDHAGTRFGFEVKLMSYSLQSP
jgi:hypothetical protein